MTRYNSERGDRIAASVRRLPLIAAAMLLAVTATMHLSELPEASRWASDGPHRVMTLLWLAPAMTWLIIASFWLYHAVVGVAPELSAVIMTALLPLVVAVPLLVRVSPTHAGGYMLLGSSVLALFSRKGAR